MVIRCRTPFYCNFRRVLNDGTQARSVTHELFISRLDELINMRHPLVRLAGLIGLAEIERTFSEPFTSGRGRPALAPRLIARLLYLQHIFDASDDAVVNTWIENPYWQYFCGELYLQTEAPIDPSSLTRWRKRIGEEGVETLLMVTIEAARRCCEGVQRGPGHRRHRPHPDAAHEGQEQAVCLARA